MKFKPHALIDSCELANDTDQDNEHFLPPLAPVDNTMYLSNILIKLQEACELPSSTVHAIYSDVQNFLQVASGNITSEILKGAEAHNIAVDVKEKLAAAASRAGFEEAFLKLDSAYKRNKYFKQNYPYVKPLAMRYQTENGLDTSEFQYIPLLRR